MRRPWLGWGAAAEGGCVLGVGGLLGVLAGGCWGLLLGAGCAAQLCWGAGGGAGGLAGGSGGSGLWALGWAWSWAGI